MDDFIVFLYRNDIKAQFTLPVKQFNIGICRFLHLLDFIGIHKIFRISERKICSHFYFHKDDDCSVLCNDVYLGTLVPPVSEQNQIMLVSEIFNSFLFAIYAFLYSNRHS